ncbi:ABC transporter ATP-binding protein [Oribacterium sp. WCC10]|uniref:ABC transporter ATP-binding protein n=1 Tax=Oribacterium sp. WCC10 TaxID=1855343 RepID=UPI0008E14D9C|nr:ABC transporter ATP-binding protein [Oribacterium sp. WCC10]SFG56893.1 putative ABC transport system ATP-binding protein [Oribacterium sp. WCC10]
MEPLIKVRDLYKIFNIGLNAVPALNGVSFDIYKGEFIAIVGTSGSGKSTCLNMLAGLEAPSKGIIQIANKRIDRMNEAQLVAFRRQNVGFIFQSYNLIPSMNALENVAMPLMFRGVDYKERTKAAKHYMELMGIGDQCLHMPNQMSGGQQQRVGIARALVIDPKIIFADEPTGNLDSHTTDDVLTLMKKIVSEEHRTLIMVTHDPHIASWADRQIRVVDGHVVETVINNESPIEMEILKENGEPPFCEVKKAD